MWRGSRASARRTEQPPPPAVGIIPRLNTELFEQLEAAKAKEPDKQFMVRWAKRASHEARLMPTPCVRADLGELPGDL